LPAGFPDREAGSCGNTRAVAAAPETRTRKYRTAPVSGSMNARYPIPFSPHPAIGTLKSASVTTQCLSSRGCTFRGSFGRETAGKHSAVFLELDFAAFARPSTRLSGVKAYTSVRHTQARGLAPENFRSCARTLESTHAAA